MKECVRHSAFEENDIALDPFIFVYDKDGALRDVDIKSLRYSVSHANFQNQVYFVRILHHFHHD